MSIISTMSLFVFGISQIRHIIKINYMSLIKDLARIIIAVIGMIAIILIIGPSLHYLLSMVIAGMVYIVLILVMKLISIGEIKASIKK